MEIMGIATLLQRKMRENVGKLQIITLLSLLYIRSFFKAFIISIAVILPYFLFLFFLIDFSCEFFKLWLFEFVKIMLAIS